MLTIVRYPKYMGFFGVLSMALFRITLSLNKRIEFWKLLGCGKNGTFDKRPDWRQWGILAVTKKRPGVRECLVLYGSFINKWWEICQCEVYTILLEPIEGHGRWDGKEVFGTLSGKSDYDGPLAVLTRATIRLMRLKNFWKHVEGVAEKMRSAPGFIMSVGVGEIPWIKQATFSVWESKEDIKAFAYESQEHAAVIRKTRQENWYREDMFIRFKILGTSGTLSGVNPLRGKL